MRLGTLLGEEAWAKLNEAARDKRLLAAKKRKEAFAWKKRREQLNEAGFVPLKTSTDWPTSWVAE